MTSGVYIRTPEMKTRKGQTGYKHTDEAKAKISAFMRGKKHHTKPHAPDCSHCIAMRGKPAYNKGKPSPLRGENSPTWRGGLTPINHQIRASLEYKQWRRAVFDRDDYTCQACAQRGSKLHADHELPFSLFPALRFEILNGRTLCVSCHRKTHTWGSKALQFYANS